MSPTASKANNTQQKANAGKTKKGEQRRKQILDACKRVLLKDGYTRFYMQNVADEAELSLSNLQYYFRNKEELAQAFIEDIGKYYTQEVEGILDSIESGPMDRFLAVIDNTISQLNSPDDRYFFVQLWAMLGALDPNKVQMISEMYQVYTLNLARIIEEVNPLLTKGERHQRATMIAAMFEGMYLMLENADAHRQETQPPIVEQLRKQALRIAMAP